jgi:MtfA peptidase
MKRPLPNQWLAWLQHHVPFFQEMDETLRQRFLDLLKAFVWDKRFEGAADLEITDEHRVVIAAAAVRLVLHLDLSFYDHIGTIIVYPYVYRHAPDGQAILGEVHQSGSMVLSWPSAIKGMKNPVDGDDTAVHEFAHVLDLADGGFDGTPQLHRFGDYRSWARIMSTHFAELQENLGNRRNVIGDYGATNEAEFFAVASEAFFEQPERMQKKAPDLYHELLRFYQPDEAQKLNKEIIP